MIILTTIKLHTIFYAYTSFLDKYCEKEKHMMINAENFKQAMALWDNVFLFG